MLPATFFSRLPLLLLSLGLVSDCKSNCGDAGHRPAPIAAVPRSPTSPEKTPPTTEAVWRNKDGSPTTLVTLDKPAYHTKLNLAADAIYLLTLDAAFRLVPGQAPQEIKLDHGDSAATTPSAIIYWSKSFLWLAPKQGGAPGRVASVKDQPLFIVAVDERFAWVSVDAQGQYAIFNLRQGEPHAVYRASGAVVAATMVEDRVVFIERVGEESWRLGSVARSGGSPSFTVTRKGRYPAMLAAAASEVYYYCYDDKDLSEVRAVSPDLRTERVVANNVICSPLAAADRVFCAHVEGLFELSPTGGPPKLVYPNIASAITAIGVDQDRVVWVRDVGHEKLDVKLFFRNAIPQ